MVALDYEFRRRTISLCSRGELGFPKQSERKKGWREVGGRIAT